MRGCLHNTGCSPTQRPDPGHHLRLLLLLQGCPNFWQLASHHPPHRRDITKPPPEKAPPRITLVTSSGPPLDHRGANPWALDAAPAVGRDTAHRRSRDSCTLMMENPGLSRPCEPASFAAQPVLCQLPPPVPPVAFEFTRSRARAPNPRKPRHAKHPLLQPSLEGERGLPQPSPPTATRPHGVNVNQLVWGMDRQSLDTYGLAGQEPSDWRAFASSHHDRMQELVREQGDMIMDVDPDEVEAKEAPLPPMPHSFEMMRMRRKWTRRGRPAARPWRPSEDARTPQPEQPSPTTQHTQTPMTGPLLAHWHSPHEVGPEEAEDREAPTIRNFKSMPMRRKYTRRGRPLYGQDANPQPEMPSTTRHAQNTTTEPLPAYWRNQPPVAVDPVGASACLDPEPDEGYCEGADDMAWLEEAGILMDGLPSNGRLRFKTSVEAAMQCSVVVQRNPRMRRRRQGKMETRPRASSTLVDASFDTCSSSMLGPPEVPDLERLLAPISRRISSDETAQNGTEAAATTGRDEH